MTPPPARRSALLAAATLWWRELVRFLRQPSRVVGALAQPLVFWLVIGSGLSASFRPRGGEADYLEYFFPGILILVLLFTAIFSTISLIEDRRSGFLQAVLVAPVPRTSLVLGHLAGGATLAVGQALLLLLLIGPFAGLRLTPPGVLAAIGIMGLVGVGLGGLGFVLAWRMESIQGFHAIMFTGLFPLWLLSGAAFPAAGAPGWLRGVMTVNPITYGLAALRRGLSQAGGGGPAGWPLSGGVPTLPVALGVLAVFAGVMVALAIGQARRPG